MCLFLCVSHPRFRKKTGNLPLYTVSLSCCDCTGWQFIRTPYCMAGLPASEARFPARFGNFVSATICHYSLFVPTGGRPRCGGLPPIGGGAAAGGLFVKGRSKEPGSASVDWAATGGRTPASQAGSGRMFAADHCTTRWAVSTVTAFTSSRQFCPARAIEPEMITSAPSCLPIESSVSWLT